MQRLVEDQEAGLFDKGAGHQDQPLLTIEACGNFLHPYFSGRCNEMVYLLCLDAKGKAIACRLVGEGGINSAGVPIRKIVEIALSANATTVVLAHNHPFGAAEPSKTDDETTQLCHIVCGLHSVVLCDHIIYSPQGGYSYYLSGKLKQVAQSYTIQEIGKGKEIQE
jgi:DNA repair protein RadC